MLLALFLLPVLITSIWYGRQVRQQWLDHALIEAIKKQDTPRAIALLDQGADANACDTAEPPQNRRRNAVESRTIPLNGHLVPSDCAPKLELARWRLFIPNRVFLILFS